VSPAGEVKLAGHPTRSLTVAAVNDCWNNNWLRNQPLRNQISFAGIDSILIGFQVVVQRNQRGGGKQRAASCIRT
jgi:hypothetical protein